MHEPLLALAALPAPTVVLGMLLRPYSLGHELFLIREGSPFAPGATQKPELGDLYRAVLICCQTWQETREMPFEPLATLKLWLWKKRMGSGVDFDAERAAFLSYQAQGSLEFPLSDVARPGRGSAPRIAGSPFLLRLHGFVMENLRKSEAEAWDYPLGLAKMRWACFWEQQDGLDVYNAHDAEFDRFIAEQEKKGAEQCPV